MFTPGTKVKWTGQTQGYHYDLPEGELQLDVIYTVRDIEMRSWDTKVYLVERPGRYYNSVWFEEVLYE